MQSNKFNLHYPLNILTIDLEDWFHILDHEGTATENDWERYPSRIHQGMEILLGILAETQTPATFFVVGWMARRHPDIIRRLDVLGYEIACQSDLHQLVYRMDKEAFRQDTLKAIGHIEDSTGKKVTAYRAPGFSITEATPWAFEVLAEAGITHDSSVFPAYRAHGGFPSFPSHVPTIVNYSQKDMDQSILKRSVPINNQQSTTDNQHSTLNNYKGITIKEFPITTTNLLGNDIVFGGGGYFRLFPYPLIKHWTQQKQEYLMAYIHPRDVDAGQPILPGLSPMRRFKSYYGIKGAEQKLRKWLTNFRFTDLRTFDKAFDWGKAEVVEVSGRSK